MTQQDLIRDLRVFADPATEYTAQETSTAVGIKLIREGTSRDFLFDLESGAAIARHTGGRRYPSVRALLSSEEFADTRTLRATQRRLLSQRLGDCRYLPPEGEIVASSAPEHLTFDTIKQTIRYKLQDSISIMLLDGPAGVGKTSLIERLVFERTDPASEEPPLLHVASSGSRLTDLSKALAHATQILRTSVTFDQVPILVRRGVLQVAIDGFDELVDPSGYRDAWFALREFLGEVRFGGPTILSGRDTFFDQQTFQKRLAERIPNLDLRYARLQPVGPAAAKAYLKTSGWSDEQLNTASAHDWFTAGSYRLRPFFLSQIANSTGWSDLEEAHGSPQAFLVNRFVTREAKLLDFLPLTLKEREQALWRFYCTLVEDMAIHEMDSVDSGYIALACETAFDGLLKPDDMNKVVQRSGSLGLLEADQHGTGSRKFPHSEIQNQFLARALIDSFDSSAGIASFVRRVPVSMAIAEAFADRLSIQAPERIAELIQKLQHIGENEPFATLLSSNICALLIAALGCPGIDSLVRLEGVSTHEARIHGDAAVASFTNVNIDHLDARGADLRALAFDNTSVNVLTVDNTTLFGDTVPHVQACVQIEALGYVNTLRARADIETWLKEHSSTAATVNDANLRLVKYFDRVCRKFMRQHQIRSSETDGAYFLVTDPLWPEIRGILGHRLAVEKSREAAGVPQVFFRMVGPERLLNPSSDDSESLDIRHRVFARARELEASE